MAKYLVIIHGDVEPELVGPFNDEDERDNRAIKHRKSDPAKEDGLFTLDIDETGIPSIDAFAAGYLDDDDDDE